MNPDTPQSGKRNTAKSGRSNASSSMGAQTQTAADEIGASVESATASVRDVASQAAEQASNVADQVRQRAESQLNTQKERATASLGSMASAVRSTSQKLREEQLDGVAQYIERAADQIERFSKHLRERDLEQLANEARHFARDQPALFIGTSFAAGLLAARFIKASSSHAGSRNYGSGTEGYDTGVRGYGATAQGHGQSDLGRPFGASTAAGTTTKSESSSYGTFGDRPVDDDAAGRGGL